MINPICKSTNQYFVLNLRVLVSIYKSIYTFLIKDFGQHELLDISNIIYYVFSINKIDYESTYNHFILNWWKISLARVFLGKI